MRSRGQPLVSLALVVAVALGARTLERELPPRAAPVPEGGEAASGAWFCPHGGGKQWRTTIHVANPSTDAASVRVTPIGGDGAAVPLSVTVQPGGSASTPVPSDDRASSTLVEWFGPWVAAGWTADAGGRERGVTAEPCADVATEEWLAPDGVTLSGSDSFLVVMNPFDAKARLSVVLITTGSAPIRPGPWTDVTLRAHRARAFHLNEFRLEEQALAARVEVSDGRVAASSLVVSDPGGSRAVLATPGGPPGRAIAPGGGDRGPSELVVIVGAEEPAALDATLLGPDGPAPVPTLTDAEQVPRSARAYTLETGAPQASTIDLAAAQGSPGIVVARRTVGEGGDPAGIGAATAPQSAWIVLPTTAGEPNAPGLVVANLGSADATVTLRALQPSGAVASLIVPAGATAAAPDAFAAATAGVPVLVTAEPPTIVAAGSSSSLGKLGVGGFAASLGVPVPQGALGV